MSVCEPRRCEALEGYRVLVDVHLAGSPLHFLHYVERGVYDELVHVS